MAPPSLLSGLTIVQVAIVTPDLEACAARQAALFGNGPWRVFELGAHNIRDYTLHGEPATGSTLLGLNDSHPQVELLQPLDGTTTHREWLEQHGQSVHHIAAVVPSVHEAVAALIQAEAITPEQVHGQIQVGQLISDLFTMQDPPATELRDLAKRLTALHG